MLGVTSIRSHSDVGSQALDEVHHRLVDVSLWQHFPDGLQGDFQLISRLRLRLEFYGTFPAWFLRCDSPVRSNLECWNDLNMNPFVFS